MAEATVWKCYRCEHIGPEEGFRTPEGHRCPETNCVSEDVFPHRMYECEGCGEVGDQNQWFPKFPLDDDPLEERVEAKSCEGCVDKQDEKNQRKRTKVTRSEWSRLCDELKELGKKPAELKEIPFKLPSAHTKKGAPASRRPA